MLYDVILHVRSMRLIRRSSGVKQTIIYWRAYKHDMLHYNLHGTLPAGPLDPAVQARPIGSSRLIKI